MQYSTFIASTDQVLLSFFAPTNFNSQVHSAQYRLSNNSHLDLLQSHRAPSTATPHPTFSILQPPLPHTHIWPLFPQIPPVEKHKSPFQQPGLVLIANPKVLFRHTSNNFPQFPSYWIGEEHCCFLCSCRTAIFYCSLGLCCFNRMTNVWKQKEARLVQSSITCSTLFLRINKETESHALNYIKHSQRK